MKEAIPDIIISIIFLFIIIAPIAVAIDDYVRQPVFIETIEEEIENKPYNNDQIIAALLMYQASHLSECDRCTQTNFPACEKSKGFMDAILNFN